MRQDVFTQSYACIPNIYTNNLWFIDNYMVPILFYENSNENINFAKNYF